MSKQLTEGQIRAVITELGERHVKLTGSMVRRELRRRCGSPGGVSRVYRLLQEFQKTAGNRDHDDLAAENAELQIRLRAATDRAQRAEQREETHQARWAMEVDSLRQQLRDALAERRLVPQLQDQILELRRTIHKLANPSEEPPVE